MKTMTQTLQTPTGRRKLFLVLLGGIIVSFFLYGFAIASTTISIAEAQTDNREIERIETEIAELELEYFHMVSLLSLDQAIDEGFTEIANVHYARVNETKAVAYNL